MDFQCAVAMLTGEDHIDIDRYEAVTECEEVDYSFVNCMAYIEQVYRAKISNTFWKLGWYRHDSGEDKVDIVSSLNIVQVAPQTQTRIVYKEVVTTP